MKTLPYFSMRLPADLTPSPTAVQLRHAEANCNLMQSNPTVCGFEYPEIPPVPMAAGAYDPHPLGLASARDVIATYVSERYGWLEAAQLMLTASTSEAYGLLFKLLTDPGDSIVVGTPGYPLVQHLAELEHLRVQTFSNRCEAGRWHADIAAAEKHLAAGARLVVLICPNNPTGEVVRPEEAEAWAALANRYHVPLIIDHVFAPYGAADWPDITAKLAAAPGAFFLDGMSKAAGLPHVKLGWVAVRGAAPFVHTAMARLAWLGDAYLSVSQAVQAAAPALLATAGAVQPQIRQRIAANRRWLADALAALPEVSLLPSDGGWYGVLRLPQSVCEDDVVVALAREARVQLHPGYFYDFEQRGHLVTGLLLQPASFASGWRKALKILQDLYR